jgi:hypothetical protein
MAMIFPLFGIFWAFFFVTLEMYAEVLKKVSKVNVLPSLARKATTIFYSVYIASELGMMIKDQLNYRCGDIQVYNFLNSPGSFATEYNYTKL